ncbi:MAG TPA: DUF6443 domain-containing protein [Cyclobacteriaceae bacterium]|nr:DUF6443 domain-containing protein [Cyclobacteriaceae bacterium]
MTQPSPVSVSINDPGPQCSTSGISFTATPTNGGNSPTYEWYRNGSPVTDNQIQGNTNIYSPQYTLQNGETIRCLMTSNASGCISGNPAWSNLVTISVITAQTPSISVVPDRTSICDGESVTFTASTSHPVSGSITWSLGGTPQGTGTSFTITNFQSDVSYNVTASATVTGSCLTTNSVSSTYSATNITVNPRPVASASGQTICSGNQTSIEVTSNLSGTAFTWSVEQSSGVTGASGGSGSLPLTIQQTLTNSTSSDGMVTYNIAPSKGACSGTTISPVVTLQPSVTPTVSITHGPSSICAGESITFTASSLQTITSYSWSINQGSTLSTNSDFTTSALAAGDVVYLTIGVSGQCLTASTVTANTSSTLQVKANPTATITPVGSTEICSTCQQVITAATGSGYVYTWRKDGVVLSEVTGSFYTTNQPGSYDIDINLNGCLKTTAVLNLSVNAAPEVDAGGNQLFYLPTSTRSLEGSAYDPNGSIITYQWTKLSGPGVTMTDANTARLTLSNLIVGIYTFRFTVTDNFGETASEDVEVQVQNLPNNYNWIKETVVAQEGTTTQTQIDGLSTAEGEKIVNYTYFDGLGRPMQTVGVQNSPGGWDVVQPVIYDEYGREVKKYLPYASNQTNGWYKLNSVGDGTPQNPYASSPQYQFYQQGGALPEDTAPFADTKFEPSPLNRVLKQGSPGAAWQPDGDNSYTSTDRTIKLAYETNSASEVRMWTYIAPTTTYALGLVNAGTASSPVYYSANQLYKTKTKDEEYNVVIEYKDKLGRLVLKRVQAVAGTPAVNDTNYASTYYIYDDFGNLVCVLPPEATKRLDTEYHHAVATDATKNSFLNRWAFRYTYDARKRMTQKQVPGADPEYMVYDNRDRVVLTQNGLLRVSASKMWIYTKYDELNRPILTGRKDTTVTLTQAQMQVVVDAFYNKTWTKLYESYVGNAAGNVHGYTNKSYPVVNASATVNKDYYLTVTYYDNYDFRSLWLGSYAYVNDGLSENVSGIDYAQPAAERQYITGQITGTKVAVFDGSIYSWVKSVNYYDDKYRVVQVISDNYKSGFDRTSTLYDFAGKVLESKTTHLVKDITWKDKVGLKQEGRRLIRTASGSGWGTSGAASVQQLSASTNGWIEFTASETNLARMIGLSDQNTNANYTTIDFAWYLLNTGAINVYENGANRGSFGTYVPGDVFKIERTGTTIKYFQNNVLKYTSSVASSSVLMADVAIHGSAGTVINVGSSFGQNSKTVTRRFVYDAAGRMTETWHQVDAEPEVRIAYNEYNELGQLIDKKLHSTTAMAANAKQSVDFRYNIRGWLTKINDSDVSTVASGDATRDYFGMELGYNEAIGTSNAEIFNGNISGIKWSLNQGYGSMKEMAYNFSYDPMNRLLSATHLQSSGTWGAGKYDESGLSYDLNGNILALQRKGEDGVQIDNLVYNYGTGTTASNKLLYVQDNTTIATDKAKGFVDGNTGTATDYTYDVNGNMTRDLNKGIGTSTSDNTNLITYNFLNLPARIVKGGNSILNIYDATGRKHAQEVTTGTITKQTDYVGEFIYENDVLQFINHEEGRIVEASNKLVLANPGESTSTMTAVNTTLATYTSNGENYIQVTSNGTTARSGVFPIGAAIPVQPGERYRIRAKGYGTNNAVYLAIKASGIDLSWPGSTLPSGAKTESWIEQTVTIPAGATTLEAGVTWNAVTAGDVFYLNEFEITQLTTVTPEYQYHLKDHLGNVRVTITTKDETEESMATLESANETAEQSQFIYYDEAVKINTPLFDHTDEGTTFYSARLSGNSNEQNGLAKSLSVMPGDVVRAEVYVKYLDPTTDNWSQSLIDFMAAIANGTAPAGTVVDGGLIGSTGGATPPYIGLLDKSGESGTAPMAYLNWLVFDRDYNFITGGFERMTEAAREDGTDVPHVRLAKELTITEPGYVYLYTSNDNLALGGQQIETYWDDFKVEHVKSPIVQQNDYYPFGLTFNSYQRENSVTNLYQYNGKELQHELDLGWLDYEARMYMPEIGRFFVPDPLASIYQSNSPYIYALSNPIRYIDKFGLGPGDRVKKAQSFLQTNYKQETDSKLRTGTDEAALQYLDCSELVSRVLADDGLTDGIKHMNTGGLKTFFEENEYVKSNNPEVGDIFLWTGHTGVVTAVDGDKVTITHAKGTAYGTIEETKSLTYFTEHKGWQGFFRPETETPDKEDPKPNNDNQKSADYWSKKLHNAILKIENWNKKMEDRLKRAEERKKKRDEKNNS